MGNFKKVLKFLVVMVYSFVSAIPTAGFLNLSFNFPHGITNNSEAIFSVTIGSFFIFLFLTIDFILLYKIIKSKDLMFFEKIIFISFFVFAKFLGFLVDRDGWRNFFVYFSYWLNS